jgi:hypothetical protein
LLVRNDLLIFSNSFLTAVKGTLSPIFKTPGFKTSSIAVKVLEISTGLAEANAGFILSVPTFLEASGIIQF